MRGVGMLTIVASCSFAVGCGGGSESSPPSLDVPEGATFCSVFDGEYATALAASVPVTDPTFQERAQATLAWSEILRDLAPPEIADQAEDNVSYHRAQAALRSAADFIPGSNDMHAWAHANC